MVIDIVNFGLNSWTPILRSLEHCIIGEDIQNVVHSDYQVVRYGPTLHVVVKEKPIIYKESYMCRCFKFFDFQLHRLSWWTAITFFIGSIFFTGMMRPVLWYLCHCYLVVVFGLGVPNAFTAYKLYMLVWVWIQRATR